jgi:hypothetical protein
MKKSIASRASEQQTIDHFSQHNALSADPFAGPKAAPAWHRQKSSPAESIIELPMD